MRERAAYVVELECAPETPWRAFKVLMAGTDYVRLRWMYDHCAPEWYVFDDDKKRYLPLLDTPQPAC